MRAFGDTGIRRYLVMGKGEVAEMAKPEGEGGAKPSVAIEGGEGLALP